MGLIKSAVKSASGAFKETWKDYFVCSVSNGELMRKVSRRTDGTNEGSDSIVTHNSKISVPVGVAMVITSGGQVIEFTADPGEFIFDTGGAPSFFDAGGFFKGIKNVWQEGTRRFQYGGEIDRNMNIYAVNIKEVMGNKFGTPEPVPYEDPVYRNINLKYHGSYNFRIENVLTFISTLAGTELRTSYRVENFTEGMREIFMTYLNQEINQLNIPYTKLSSSGIQITERMVVALKDDWYDSYGILITKVGINAPTLDEKSQKRVEKFGDAMFFQDTDMARGHIAGSTGDAIKDAANNPGGSMMGMMGVNMAGQAGGNILNSPAFAPKEKSSVDEETWKCSCGKDNTGKFCAECGNPKPIAPNAWLCSCGKENVGKFCAECGNPKPATNEWQCECGAFNESKFCSECGEERK